jgi:hypothetical protein
MGQARCTLDASPCQGLQCSLAAAPMDPWRLLLYCQQQAGRGSTNILLVRPAKTGNAVLLWSAGLTRCPAAPADIGQWRGWAPQSQPGLLL